MDNKAPAKIITEGAWVPEDAVTRLSELTIAQGANIRAPGGKGITMTVNGVGTAIEPGHYSGDIVLTVAGMYVIPGEGDPFLFGKDLPIRCAYYIRDGKVVTEACVPALLSGGNVSATGASGISFTTREDSFNGIILSNSDFVISDSTFDLTGSGCNDNYGVGAAIMGLGNSHITLDNVTITAREATLRAVTYIGDDCVLTVKNSRISVDSGRRGLRSRCWMMGIRGTNRALQQSDRARSYYENCDIHSDGWGIFSTETTQNCSVYVKDSRCDLSGEIARGYGLMSIGNCTDTFDNCQVNVQGYAIIVCEPLARGVITGGSRINATLNAGLIFRNHHGGFRIDQGSVVRTGRSTFVVKGAQTTISCDSAILQPGNGTVLQLMDNDDVGIGIINFKPAVGETDVYIEGRDLTVADPDEDVFAAFSNMDISGDFYNSTTNLHVQTRGDKGETPDMPAADFSVLPPPDPDAPPQPVKRGTGQDLQGPKNAQLHFSNCNITGVISSAVQAYADGVTLISIDNCEELSNITQTAAQAVNNGMIVILDGNSIWTVTGTSYLTKLVIEDGARISAAEGTLAFRVNGALTDIRPGTYIGNIELSPEC